MANQSQYAKHRGVSSQTVAEAIAAGRITATVGKGRQKVIDPVQADAEWEKNTDQAQAARGSGNKRNRSEEYWRVKLDGEKAATQLKQMEAAKKAGELCEVSRARMAGMSMGRMLRDSVLGIPAKLGLDPETERRVSDALRAGLEDVFRLSVDDLKRMVE